MLTVELSLSPVPPPYSELLPRIETDGTIKKKNKKVSFMFIHTVDVNEDY